MAEETQEREPEKTTESSGGPLAGERLATARREKQITVEEIAKELHIDDYKVRALERNDFEILGAPVFAKGHLRKYAQLVDIPVEDVLADYYSLNRTVGMPPLVGRTRRPSREINLVPWLVALVLLLLGGAVYWWFFEREVPPPPAVDTDNGRVSMPAPADGNPDAIPEEADETPPEPEDDAVPPESATTSPAVRPAPTTNRPPASTAAAGDVQLAVLYSGDCWTEITDAAGDRLFFGLGKSGRTVTVSGTPPLSVLFGDADNVRLQLNGADYAIPAASRRGQTARLSIQAP
jgi:cytoskeleton protein RodZ